MPRRRELPFDPSDSIERGEDEFSNPILSKSGLWTLAVREMTDAAELAACRPFEEARAANDVLLSLREAIQDAIDELPELERRVFDEYVVGRKTFRALAIELSAEYGIKMSYSKIWRTRNRAIETLRLRLQDHPLVIEFLKG